MALGLPLEKVVPMVTANPAKMIDRANEIGALKVGMDADVTVLTQRPGRYVLRDNENTEVIADSLLQPVFCLRAGVRHGDSEGLANTGARPRNQSDFVFQEHLEFLQSR